MIKNILVIIMVLFILYITIANNLSYITDWSNAELVGHNSWTIIVIAGASYIIYRILKPKNKTFK